MGVVWEFSIHEFGDIRENCAKVGPALVTENNIADVTISTSIDFQMFTQDDFMQDIGPIIGKSIKVTVMDGDMEDIIGCCVIGKGTPIDDD